MMSSFATVVIALLLALTTEAFQGTQMMRSPRSIQSTQLKMVSGNKANFGLFSPAVVVAKFVLGEAKLNKVCNQSTSVS
jgi:hypothetical protein